MKVLLDVSAVCARVGVADQVVYWAAKGHLRVAKTARPYRFTVESVDAWAAKRATATHSSRSARVPLESVATRLLPSMTNLMEIN